VVLKKKKRGKDCHFQIFWGDFDTMT
jgi:hypothetical protein